LDTFWQSAQLLHALSHPARLRLLDALSTEEECVCHLTALLGKRQAYISQHLASLRRAGLVSMRKEGLRAYYRVSDLRVRAILKTLRGSGVQVRTAALRGCRCPKCKEK
jgi:ArsR family transcriptional regulator